MYIRQLRIRDFRNYNQLDVTFQPGFHLFTGYNGQGKSNLLEAIYLLGTLKSFRGVSNIQMVARGRQGYFVGGTVVSEGESYIKIWWSPQERKLSLNGQNIIRTADFYGKVRCVVFCTEDIFLVKGAPSVRRRYMDLLLAQSDSSYLSVLQRYGQALQARNALLKEPVVNFAVIDSFSQELIASGIEITRRRRELIRRISPLVQNAYINIAGKNTEKIDLHYRPNIRSDMAVELAQARSKEIQCRYTTVGPHRDDLAFEMNGIPVVSVASEGQKRTWALALKIAQTEYLREIYGGFPILLIDDVMGELDTVRRQSLLPLLSQMVVSRGQTFMTCTEKNWPRELGLDMVEWKIEAGRIALDKYI